ncbi:hypothetical protein Mycsm_06553 (plasmid) [Mycobacterium sp. JS623]|uniref:hypothetical protein n=1 Tax=Mycobacterium sp. JS623 TaxID=212767 RepID=UPI0002A579BB|nr:hypothetical protein [Mycobacterium sp. JS623]AGB26690.1 hypothetical protein Mycsm_06553 [Mycobacterium sp. JS623]
MTGPIVSNGRALADLLPAFYLVRDAQAAGGNGMLGALLELLDAEVAQVESELARRYASLFIETCTDDDLTHFAALLGVRQLPGNQHPRALIGNIISYRRGKGTIATLERVAAAVSGWNAHAVEYFRLLATTANLNHLRLGNTNVSVRDPAPLDWSGTPFDPLAHLVDVRSIATDRGRYNIPNVGVHLWRLEPVTTVDASDAAPVDATRFRFHPLGIDTALYSIGGLVDDIGAAPTGPAAPKDVTAPIGLLQMRRDLAAYYGTAARQSVCVFIDHTAVPIESVCVCDLADFGAGWRNTPPPGKIAIDPTRGRLAFATAPDGPVSVRLTRARPMEIGSRDLAPATDAAHPPVVVPDQAATLGAAISELPNGSGVVALRGSTRYAPAGALAIGPDADVTITATTDNWPVLDATATTFDCGDGANLTLTGLLIDGGPVHITGSPASVTLDSCTLVPGYTLAPDGTPRTPDGPSLWLDLAAGAGTAVMMTRCVSGPIRVGAPDVTISLADSIVTESGRGGHAHPEPALIGAALTNFPAWPADATALRLQIGVEAALDLHLTTTPTSPQSAAAALRAALQAAMTDPTSPSSVDLSAVSVLVHDQRLVIIAPGTGAVSAADASETDTAATLLGLTEAAGGYWAWSLLGDPVAEPLDLGTALPAHLTGALGAPGAGNAFDVTLTAAPTSVNGAAPALQTALAAVGNGTPLVVVDDGRLRVIPGGKDEAIRFFDGPAARALGLYAAAPVLAGSSDAILPAPALTTNRVTLLGAVRVETADVSDSIITGTLLADRRQTGCIRYSYVGAGSQTPRQFRCVQGGPGAPTPEFVSLRFGNPGLALHSPGCARPIAQGAEDGSQMGAFCSVRQPQRLGAVASVLTEFVRVAAVSGIVLQS